MGDLLQILRKNPVSGIGLAGNPLSGIGMLGGLMGEDKEGKGGGLPPQFDLLSMLLNKLK